MTIILSIECDSDFCFDRCAQWSISKAKRYNWFERSIDLILIYRDPEFDLLKKFASSAYGQALNASGQLLRSKKDPLFLIG